MDIINELANSLYESYLDKNVERSDKQKEAWEKLEDEKEVDSIDLECLAKGISFSQGSYYIDKANYKKASEREFVPAFMNVSSEYAKEKKVNGKLPKYIKKFEDGYKIDYAHCGFENLDEGTKRMALILAKALIKTIDSQEEFLSYDTIIDNVHNNFCAFMEGKQSVPEFNNYPKPTPHDMFTYMDSYKVARGFLARYNVKNFEEIDREISR